MGSTNSTEKRYAKKLLFLIISQVATLLFSPTSVFAVSKFELFIKDHPFRFGFSLVFFSLFIVLIPMYVFEIVKFINKLIEIITGFEEKKDIKEKENEYRKAPRGLIEEEVALSLSPAELIWRKEVGKLETYKLRPNIEFWIGRSEDNELILEDELVTRLHAKIRPQREGYVLYDLHSYNGTKINGKKALKHILENNDEINIGKQIINFKQETGKSENNESQPRAIKDKDVLVKYIVYAPEQPMLEKQAYAKLISESHIFIRTDKYIPETEATVEMQIQFPNGEVINEILGNLLSCRQTPLKDEYELDIELSGLPEEKQQIISNYIKNRP